MELTHKIPIILKALKIKKNLNKPRKYPRKMFISIEIKTFILTDF